MAKVYLDHPGDLHWFKGYGPREVLGPCPHAGCPHNAQTVVAWGPDTARYELMDCDVDDGCAGNCRAWVDGRGEATSPWLQVRSRGGTQPRSDLAPEAVGWHRGWH